MRRPEAWAPWERDYRVGGPLAGAGCAALVLAVVIDGQAGAWLALAGVATFAGGWKMVRRGRRREFGKAFEDQASSKATIAIRAAGGHVRRSVPVPSLGDADLLVDFGVSTALVEIKSFRRWVAWLGFFLGKRERDALEQAKALAKRTGAQTPVVWLPQGTPTWLQRKGIGAGRGGVLVVFGDERELLRVLESRK